MLLLGFLAFVPIDTPFHADNGDDYGPGCGNSKQYLSRVNFVLGLGRFLVGLGCLQVRIRLGLRDLPCGPTCLPVCRDVRAHFRELFRRGVKDARDAGVEMCRLPGTVGAPAVPIVVGPLNSQLFTFRCETVCNRLAVEEYEFATLVEPVSCPGGLQRPT